MAGSAEMQNSEMTKPALASGLCNNTCAGEARKPFGEVYMTNIEQISGKGQALGSVGDELRASFERAAQPANGWAVGDYDFIKSVGRLFGVELSIANYGTCGCQGRIEVAGRAPRRALKGLRQGCDAPLTWRQGIAGDSVAYALPGGLAQLADLLAEAGEVRQ